MGNVIHSASWVKPVSYTGTSEQTAWPASNLGLISKPNAVWRTTSVLTQNTTKVVLDFGVTNPAVVAMVIDGTNWSTLKIQKAAASDLTGATDLLSSTVLSTDAVDGRKKIYASFAAVNQRYIGITYTGTTNTSYGWMGSVACLSAVTTMASNPGFPLVYTSEQAVMANADLAGGGRAPIRLGQLYATLSFAQSAHPSSSRSDLFTLARTYSSADPLVMYLNNSDTSQVYICYRTTPLAVAQTGPNAYALPNALTFEECV